MFQKSQQEKWTWINLFKSWAALQSETNVETSYKAKPKWGWLSTKHKKREFKYRIGHIVDFRVKAER